MERYFYNLGQKDSYYGLSRMHLIIHPRSREAYLNGYADYCESFV